jgi:hypothetical protein
LCIDGPYYTVLTFNHCECESLQRLNSNDSSQFLIFTVKSAYNMASYITKQLTTQKNENCLQLEWQSEVKNAAGFVITNPKRFLNTCGFCSSLTTTFHQGQELHILSKTSRPAMGPSQHLLQMVSAAFSLGIKRTGGGSNLAAIYCGG